MKYEGKIIKYIFFIVIIGLLIIAVYIISSDNRKLAAQVEEHVKKETYKDSISLGITGLDSLNPLLTKNKDVQYILKLIYKPLLDVSKDFEIEPGLAEEYSKLDNKTYILKLREDVFWHDQEKFTAEDVVFTINALKNSWQESIYFENVKDIEEILIIGNNTLKILLKKEIPFFEYKLVLPIMPKHQYNEKYELVMENPVGTGIYHITSISNEKIVLESNTAKTKQIYVMLYKRNADMYSNFLKQELDFITTSNINYEKYLGTIGYKSLTIPDRHFNYILINQSNAWLKDGALRKALDFGINRKEIIYSVYNSKYLEMNFPQDTGMKTEYNQNEAKKILEQAGYNLKNGILYKNGKRISLNLSVNSSDKNNSKVSEIIKENLKKIGININIIILSKPNYEYNLANNYYELILTESVLCLEPNYKAYFKLNNREVEDILKEIENIDNQKVKTEKIEQLKEFAQAANPFIGLYVDTNTLLLSRELKGDFDANWYNIFYNADTWYAVDR